MFVHAKFVKKKPQSNEYYSLKVFLDVHSRANGIVFESSHNNARIIIIIIIIVHVTVGARLRLLLRSVRVHNVVVRILYVGT